MSASQKDRPCFHLIDLYLRLSINSPLLDRFFLPQAKYRPTSLTIVQRHKPPKQTMAALTTQGLMILLRFQHLILQMPVSVGLFIIPILKMKKLRTLETTHGA